MRAIYQSNFRIRGVIDRELQVKRYNDTCGHDAGDQLLKLAGKVLDERVSLLIVAGFLLPLTYA